MSKLPTAFRFKTFYNIFREIPQIFQGLPKKLCLFQDFFSAVSRIETIESI